MVVAAAQPIAGVSSGRETEIEVIYPSVAARPLGQFVGGLMSIPMSLPFTPLRLIGLVVFGAVLAPLGLLSYLFAKAFGNCYVLTNRSIRARSIVWGGGGPAVPLADIASITIARGAAQDFHRAGDLRLENAQGNVLLTVPGIQFPERAKQIILDARNARLQSDESLAQIQRRK